MASVALIGLDLGSTSVRAVETRRGKGGPVVAKFAQVPLPLGAVQGGVVQDEKAVTAAVKRLWATGKFHRKEVALGVTNAQVVVREMSVSNLPDRELRKALPFQVRDVLPLPVERVLLDFYPLEDPGDHKTVRGLVIAAPKQAILAAVHAVEQAGLHVATVDLASFALLRAASRLDAQIEAIVDIGAYATTVVVHADGVPLIVRTVPRGGAEITERIAARMSIPLGEAEALKCQVGLIEGDSPAATTEAIREALKPLINEMRSSFTYLSSGERKSKVTRLALSGGSSLLPGLRAYLSADLDIDVVYADPTARVPDVRRADPTRVDYLRSSASVSIGLTLGTAR
jgi:type IV pilus assembly protein PilM